MSNANKKSEPILAFKAAQDLEAYLAGESRASKGFWLKLSKAGAVEATSKKGDAIEVALCWVGSTGSSTGLTTGIFLSA
jgi:hypothetical protein